MKTKHQLFADVPVCVAIAKLDRKTGQYFPAFRYPDGTVTTFSPSSFERERALEIAEKLLADCAND